MPPPSKLAWLDLVQRSTVRYIGRFLGEDPLAVPWEVVEYLAGQLGISDASCVKRYGERRRTPYEHAQEIQERFGYRDFTDRKWGRARLSVRAGVDARRGAGGAVQPRGDVAAEEPGAAARGLDAGPAGV
nr:DUF4158 domain-containing protein [Streptomyces sp. W4I9-2]